MSTTAITDLTAAEQELAAVKLQLVLVGDSLDNIAKATGLKGAHSSAQTGLNRLRTAQTSASQALTSVQAAAAVLEAPTPSGPVPSGPSGNWKLVFSEDFGGTVLDTMTWDPHEGWTKQNGVTDYLSNVSVSNSICYLHLPSTTSGAAIQCKKVALAVGDYCQARVNFAGNGTTIYDWPAFWASGPNWPAAGENDIAEGLGTLTVNYHSPSGAHNMGTVPGDWADGFHDYGCYRGSNFCEEYWDGQLVKKYSTDDNGAAQSLIFTVGYGGGTFVPMALAIDNVYVWSPA